MIKEHLGWLVVWGGVFGGVIGVISTFIGGIIAHRFIKKGASAPFLIEKK